MPIMCERKREKLREAECVTEKYRAEKDKEKS